MYVILIGCQLYGAVHAVNLKSICVLDTCSFDRSSQFDFVLKSIIRQATGVVCVSELIEEKKKKKNDKNSINCHFISKLSRFQLNDEELELDWSFVFQQQQKIDLNPKLHHLQSPVSIPWKLFSFHAMKRYQFCDF